MPELPAVLGSEVAGELEDGTRVMAITSGAGGYAELAAVDRAQVVPLPDHASFAEGASFLLTFLTAHIPLTRQVRMRPGTIVLVYAAAGGVGSAAIQVARALGARVFAAVGSTEKLDVCRSLGAEEAYVYDELPDDLVRRRRPRPGRRRALRAVVRPTAAARHRDRDRLRGRRVAGDRAGAARRAKRRPRGLLPRAGCCGSTPSSSARRSASCSGSGTPARLQPLVGAELPLDEVERAHELVESRQSVGKVVLDPVKALITGGRGGLGRAFAAALRRSRDHRARSRGRFDVGDAGGVARARRLRSTRRF